MKTIFHLKEDPHRIESIESLITWLDWVNLDAIATPDLIVLIEKYYFEN